MMDRFIMLMLITLSSAFKLVMYDGIMINGIRDIYIRHSDKYLNSLAHLLSNKLESDMYKVQFGSLR